MLNKSVEKTIAWFLFIGVPFATLFLVTSSVTDPVNVTKLFAAGCVGGGVFAITAVFGSKELWKTSKVLITATALFFVAAINSIIASSSPTTQSIYGVLGRQTGFVAYLVLAMVMFGAALLRAKRSFELLVWALLISGAVNIIYAAWAIAFGDFIGWSNPYGNILGLLEIRTLLVRS